MKSIPLNPRFVFNQPGMRAATADYLLEVTGTGDTSGAAQYNDQPISNHAETGTN
jgi:hypothetical protein